MILDNKKTNLKVHEWIAKYTKEGKFSLVTGHFTVSAPKCSICVEYTNQTRFSPAAWAASRKSLPAFVLRKKQIGAIEKNESRYRSEW